MEVSRCGLRWSLQRQKSISTSQEGSRAVSPHHMALQHAVNESKGFQIKCEKERPSGAIKCAICLDYYATYLSRLVRQTPADAILSTRCGVPTRQFQTRSEARLTHTCHAFLRCSCGAIGGQTRESEARCRQETSIVPHWAMSCPWIRFDLANIKHQLHLAWSALSQNTVRCLRLFGQLATPLASSQK